MNEFEKQSLQPRRHNIQPSYDFSAQFRDDSPQLPEKLPLKIMNVSRHPLQKPSQYYPPSQFKENIPELSQRDGSHVLVKDNFQYDERNQQERQRSEKSHTDFSRSLANLGRVNESVSSLEEASVRRSRPQTTISHGDSRLIGSQFQSLSSTANKFQLNASSHKDLHNTSKASTIMKDYENSYFQNQHRNTPDFDEAMKKGSWQEQKSLHTEGNSPVAKENFLQKRASGNFVKPKGELRRDEQLQKPSLDSFRKRGIQGNPVARKENHRNLTAYEAELRKRNVGHESGFSNFNHSFKTSTRASHNRTVTNKESLFSKQKRMSQEGVRPSNKSYQSQKMFRNHDPLDQYTLSEDVLYGKGGVGYSMGTEAELVGESKRNTSGEKRNKSDVGRVIEKKQTTVRGSRAAPLGKSTQSNWKQEILEIRQDIERRKKSYDRVNKFVKMCDHEEEFGDRQGSSYDHHSQQTQPTLQTLPTQFERSASPVIAPAVNIFGFSKGVDKKGAKQRKQESSIDRQQQRWMQASARNLTEIKMIDLNVDDEPRTVSRDEEALLRMKAIPQYQTNPRQICEVTAGSFVHGNACSKCFRSPCCCCSGTNSKCQIF